jgi:tight adherence protein B
MKRALAAILLLAFPVSAYGATVGGLSLSEASKASFPDRSYVVSLPPGTVARPDQVRVRENGAGVANLTVVPASAASSRGYGVVLVIDASRSMKGAPIRNAMAAARAFASHRQPAQQLGVIAFNSSPRVLLPLTRDEKQIDRVLAAEPELGRDTHIYDAVGAATRMLAGLKPAAVVVLSDGADTGSRQTLNQVAAAARNAGVRVFSVGLRSGAFDPGPLTSLARNARGSYNEATDAKDLAPIYNGLGVRLSNEYLISYRSLAGPNARVHVGVTVARVPGIATAEYTSPALRVAVPPYRTRTFWTSGAALVLVSLLVGVLVVATFWLALSRPGRRGLRRRVAQFVSPEAPEQAPAGNQHVLAASQRFTAGVQRTFEQMRWWPAFEEDLDVARIPMTAAQLVGLTLVGTVLTMLVIVGVFGGNVLVACLAFLIPLAVRSFVRFKRDRERKLFAEQLADNLQVISSALRAGHSLVGAMSVAIVDAAEPTKREFGRVVADEKLGIPLEETLSVVARRMQNRDLEQVMLVAALQRETGGNTAEVLDRVADTVRERADLQRLVNTLTAQGRMSRWIVTALPVVLALAVTALNPDYLAPLFNTGAGHVALVVAVVLLISGSFAIKKIVTIEV